MNPALSFLPLHIQRSIYTFLDAKYIAKLIPLHKVWDKAVLSSITTIVFHRKSRTDGAEVGNILCDLAFQTTNQITHLIVLNLVCDLSAETVFHCFPCLTVLHAPSATLYAPQLSKLRYLKVLSVCRLLARDDAEEKASFVNLINRQLTYLTIWGSFEGDHCRVFREAAMHMIQYIGTDALRAIDICELTSGQLRRIIKANSNLCHFGLGHEFDSGHLKLICSMGRLTSLNFNRVDRKLIRSEEMAVLEPVFPRLRYLNIGNQHEIDDFSFLRKFRQIRELYAYNTKLTVKDLQLIRAENRLQRLDVSDTPVAEDSDSFSKVVMERYQISHLSLALITSQQPGSCHILQLLNLERHLQYLKQISLYGQKSIDDSVFRAISDFMPRLECINLVKTSCSQGGYLLYAEGRMTLMPSGSISETIFMCIDETIILEREKLEAAKIDRIFIEKKFSGRRFTDDWILNAFEFERMGGHHG